MLHDEPADAFPAVEVERLVLDDAVVLELLDVNKISLDGAVVLVLHPQHLHCKLTLALHVDALLHHSVRPLAQLLQQLELLLEGVLGVVALVLLVFDAFEDLQPGRFGDRVSPFGAGVLAACLGLTVGQVFGGIVLPEWLLEGCFPVILFGLPGDGEEGDGGLEILQLDVPALQEGVHYDPLKL